MATAIFQQLTEQQYIAAHIIYLSITPSTYWFC